MIKRFLALALVLCLCMSLLPMMALADEGGDYSGKTVILYTSNIRGNIDQYLQVSAAKEAYESAGADVILVDSGDFLQGTKYSAYHNGQNMILLLDTVEYDVVAIGPHEFDFHDGSIGASAHAGEGENVYQYCDSIGTMLIKASHVKAVSNMSGSNDVFPSGSYSSYYVVQHGGGLRVGIYGLTNPRTATKINENYVAGISFSSDSKAPAGLAGQADITVCLSNAGVGATVYKSGSADIAIEGFNKGFYCGAYIVDNSTKAIESSDSLPAGVTDAAVDAAVADAKSDADSAFGSRVATSTVVMQGTNQANRAGETNTGDLVTDALLWFAQSGRLQDKIDDPYYTSSVLSSSNGGIMVDDDHIVTLWNGGNLRGFMYEGDVTVTDLRRILPYPNTISVVYMTGAQLLEQLEACSEGLPYTSSTYKLCASFMQAAGIEYTVNTKAEIDGTGVKYGSGGFGNSYEMIKTVRRVTINNINGQAFSPTDLYAVVTHDKNVENGMDASYVMSAIRHGASSVPGYQGTIDSTQTDKTVITNYDCYNVVMDYILDQLDGNLGGTYANAGSRIHLTSNTTPVSGGGGQPTGTVTLAPKVAAQNGVASVSVSDGDLSKVIANAKENGSTSIVIAPEITGTANRVSVDVPKASLASIASEANAGLTVKTPVGYVTIPRDALASIASQAKGGSVTVNLASVARSSLTEAQQEAVQDNPVFDISLASGGVGISGFGGGSVTVSLPYALKEGEDPAHVTVWYLNGAGKLEQVACTYDQKAGMATFTTDHLSYYVVGYTEEKAPPPVSAPAQTFADVRPTDWYYDSVTFAVYRGLMKGTSATAFSPSDPMTRAMLVTVLYNLEGSPQVTGTSSFTDVKDGEWYNAAVAWAGANNIVTGYGGGQFGPSDSITRQQLAAILYRYAGYKSYDVSKTADLAAYTDAPEIGAWAGDAMRWANAEGLITGRTAITLAPGGTAIRAEVASILMRFVKGIVR